MVNHNLTTLLRYSLFDDIPAVMHPVVVKRLADLSILMLCHGAGNV